MNIKITPDFASDEKLANLFTGRTPAEKDAIIKAWCKIAKLVLATGKYPTGKGTKIKDASTVVEIPDLIFGTFGFSQLESVDMVERTEKEVSTVGIEKFEEFWKTYPQRVTESGAKTRGSRRDAEKAFTQEIRKPSDFDALMIATGNYTKVCSNKPKDAVRFLRNGFYKDYATVETAQELPAKQQRTVVSPETIDKMLNGD